MTEPTDLDFARRLFARKELQPTEEPEPEQQPNHVPGEGSSPAGPGLSPEQRLARLLFDTDPNAA